MFDWLIGGNDERGARGGGCEHRNVETSGEVEECSSCGMRWDFSEYARDGNVGIRDGKKDEYDAW